MNSEFGVRRAGARAPSPFAIRHSPFIISNPRDRAAVILAAVDDLPLRWRIPPGLLDAGDAGSVLDFFEHDAFRFSSLRRFAQQTDCGGAAPHMSPRELVTHLGVATARDVALVLQFPWVFKSPNESRDERETLDRLRRHSVAVACACRMLCEQAPHLGDAATAFACGLLHDIGKFALIACCPKSYARMHHRVGNDRAFGVESERQAFGIDHAAVGGHLGVRLALSAEMVGGIRLHHQLFNESGDLAMQGLPALVQVADRIVNEEGGVDEIAARFDVEGDVLAAVARELPDRVQPFTAMFDAGASDADSPYVHESVATPTRFTAIGRESTIAIDGNRTVVRAIRRFAELLGSSAPGTTPRRVCEAAAECVREALGVDSCVAVTGSCTSDVMFLGVAACEPGGSATSHTRVLPSWSSTISDVVPSDRPDPAFAPASEACDSVWEQCLGTIPRGTLWLLPFAPPSAEGESDVRGGVLVSIGAGRDARRGMNMPGLDVLAAVMGLAAAGAFALSEQEVRTDRLADEVRRGREMLIERVRGRTMSAIVAMAGGAAHELNNPLSVISGRAQLLLGDCENEDSGEALREITDQAHSASQIVTDLMSFARPDSPRAETFRVGDFLDPLFQRWRTSSGLEGVGFELVIADRRTTIHADAKQVTEILDAVVANAIAASRPGSTCVHINSPSPSSDETVRMVVTDHGIGMTRDVLTHAFDPFFSFRESGRGRGMGLSRAYRLAEFNGGRLRLESKLGSGTTVTIELPSGATGA